MWIVGALSLPAVARAQPSASGAPGESPKAQQKPDDRALPETIPIFPLPDVVLFPNVSLPLHIFEPRYRAMVADALKGERIIGMVLLQPGYEADYEGRPPIHPIGCAGVITQVERLPDGRYNMVLSGLVKFRVTGEDRSRLYRLAHVDAMPELLNEEDKAALRKERKRLEAAAVRSLGRSGSQSPFPPEIPDEDLVNALSQYLELEPIERQELLERPGVLSRSQALSEMLEKKAAPLR
jgi:Lon protease-like protein